MKMKDSIPDDCDLILVRASGSTPIKFGALRRDSRIDREKVHRINRIVLGLDAECQIKIGGEVVRVWRAAE